MPGSDPRIVIVGAGPAGLSAAYFLRQRGYRHVLVLEKLGRVGGLVCSLTVGGRAFDLGANYVTPEYRETLRLAREVGAETYTEKPFVAMAVPNDPSQPVTYSTIFDALRVDAATGKPIPFLSFGAALLKYVWRRFRLRHIIDQPTFAGIEQHPELCVSFEDWLKANGLESLITVFELPITLMGYGYARKTPAPYALKFMTVRSFIPMVLKEAPIIGPWIPWPRRFVQGFQRMWERVSWGLDVRLNVDIKRIARREDGKIHVDFVGSEQWLNREQRVPQEFVADHLILACPLSVTPEFLDLSPAECALFGLDRSKPGVSSRIVTASYCMTTFQVEKLRIGDHISGAGPLAAVLPLVDKARPWGVAKQFDDVDFIEFYTRVPNAMDDEQAKQEVIANIHEVVQQMGGRIVDEKKAWHSYTRWPYFQHVHEDTMRAGFYTDLEALQGKQNTFYVGGVTNFELIEPIVRYAKHLVARHFPARA
jgi:hypothetical protein